jgi:hypothetical protein
VPELRRRFRPAADPACKRVAPRAIGREATAGASVEKHPPSAKRIHLSHSLDDIAEHSARITNIPPEER